MIRGCQTAALMASLLCLTCGRGKPVVERGGEPALGESPAASVPQDSGSVAGPDIVLDGTDVVDFASYTLRPLDPGAAGEYGVEQGGSVLSLRLLFTDGTWRAERTIQEPGEPEDRVVYDLTLRDGLLSAAGGDVVVRGAEDGVLMLERTSTAIPASYWVYYQRR